MRGCVGSSWSHAESSCSDPSVVGSGRAEGWIAQSMSREQNEDNEDDDDMIVDDTSP